MTDKAIRTLIVDDELLARQRIISLLADQVDVHVVGECANGADAVAAIIKHRPDLVFLDIQMPEVSGFDVVATIGADRMPVVVFATAYDQYAVRAFDVHAIDYLLKPYESDRFYKALDRARNAVKQRRSGKSGGDLKPMLADLRAEGKLADRIAVKSAGRIRLVEIADIDWVESAGNYVTLHVGETKHLLRETMRKAVDRLAPHGFVRIHRTAIVNTARIKELQPLYAGDYHVLLTTGARLTLSRRYKAVLGHLLPEL